MNIINMSKVMRTNNGFDWTVKFTIEDFSGKQFDFALVGTDKAELNKRAKRFLKSFDSSEKFSEATVCELGDLYFKNYKPTVEIETYKTTYRNFCNEILPRIGDVLMKDLDGDTIQGMLNDVALNRFESTINKVYQIIDKMITLYRGFNQMERNVMRSVVKPASKVKANSTSSDKNDYWLNQQEADKIAAEASAVNANGTKRYFYGNAVLLIMNTAITNDEMLALTWEDVDFENRTLSINKRLAYKSEDNKSIYVEQYNENDRSSRKLPLNEAAYNLLKSIKTENSNSEYVICNEKGGLSRRSSVAHTVKRIFEAVGVDCTKKSGIDLMHDYFIERMLNSGIKPMSIVYYMGNADDRFLKRFYDRRQRNEVINAFKNSEYFN